LVLNKCAEADLALVPSEGPYWWKEWLANDSVVVADNRVWCVRVHHNVDISNATCSNLLKLSDTVDFVIFDNPILGMSLLEEYTDPLVVGVWPHEEGMSSVSLVARRYTSVEERRLISVPHRVDTVIVEEGLLRALTKTHHSLVSLVCVHSESIHANPVEIRIVDDSVDFKVDRCLTLLLSELNNQWVGLDDNMLANHIANSASSGSIDNTGGDLEVLSLVSGESAILGPCPLDIDDALVENAESEA